MALLAGAPEQLATAGLGVAFNAKPLVRRQADTSLTVPFLDAVLFLAADSSGGITGHILPVTNGAI